MPIFSQQPSEDISNHPIIIVLGQAGAGKSSFVNAATGSNLAVGQNLRGCTTDIQVAIGIAPENKSDCKVVFVDTPAFDIELDDNAEIKIKKQFEKWRKKTCTQKDVTGIIYLHKISENRINEPPLRRLKTFEKLCGGDLPAKILLVTTMWNQVDQELGSAREEELRIKFWKQTTTDRPNMARFEDEADATKAWFIVNLLLEMCAD